MKGKWHMTQVQRLGVLGFAATAAFLCIGLAAQAGDAAAIQQHLNAQFRLTTTTADMTDIVTAGDVVTIHKRNLVMFQGTVPAINNYSPRNPVGIGQGFLTTLIEVNPNTVQREFVPEEKCWVIGISMQKDGVTFSLFSDPYNGIRYYGTLKIHFPDKKVVPPVDSFMQTIAEVLTVDSQNEQPEPAQPGRIRPAVGDVVQVPGIAPPPPPTDTPPPSIELGQTKDEVTAAFGQPAKIVRLGVKEIFFYKDMKVTFTDGKVSNVE
jgi:hypothetical protein